MVFANIEYLFLLLLLIPYIVWYILKQRKSEATLQISDARVYALAPKSYKNYLLHLPFILRIAAITLIIIVLARPQTTDKWQNSEIEGTSRRTESPSSSTRSDSENGCIPRIPRRTDV